MARILLLAAVAVALYLALRSAGGRVAADRLLPALAVGLALLYLASPIDLIPDAGIVGILDDLVVLVSTAVWVRRRTRAQAQRGPGHASRRPSIEPAATDPYEVLGLARGVSQDEITRAYREKMKLYHPDRVSGLGHELQEIANQKTIEIQRAYEALRVRR